MEKFRIVDFGFQIWQTAGPLNSKSEIRNPKSDVDAWTRTRSARRGPPISGADARRPIHRCDAGCWRPRARGAGADCAGRKSSRNRSGRIGVGRSKRDSDLIWVAVGVCAFELQKHRTDCCRMWISRSRWSAGGYRNLVDDDRGSIARVLVHA